MALKAYDNWLAEGWSPWRKGFAFVGAVGTVVFAIGYVKRHGHPGGVWYLVGALGIFALWLISETLRWRIKHQHMETKVDQATSDIVALRGDFTTLQNVVEGIRTAMATTPAATHFTINHNYGASGGSAQKPEVTQQPEIPSTSIPEEKS